MALRVLASHILYAAVMHQAGEVLDDSSVLYGGMVAAGARFYSAADPLIARGSALCASLRKRGASELELDDCMASFVSAARANNGANAVAWSLRGNGNASTWDDVRAILDESHSPVTINLIDRETDYQVPSGVVDLKFGNFTAAPGNNSTLHLADGAQLRNGGLNELVSGMFNGSMGVVFNSHGSSPNPIAWDSQADPTRFAPFAFGGAATLRNDGTVPVIRVRTNPDGLLVMIMANTAIVDPGSGPIVSLAPGAQLFLSISNNGAGHIDPGFVVADTPATNVVGMLTASGFDMRAIATWAGVAGATFLSNPLGMLGGAGPTSLRPMGLIAPLVPGTLYWDMDLVPSKQVSWNGTQFVDALGAGPI